MKNSIFLILILFFVSGCSEKEKEKTSEKDIENEVLNAYNSMYNSYAEGTDEFLNYYEPDFVRVESSGDRKKGVEEPKREWNNFLKTHSLYLKDFGEPEMILSDKQVVTIGDFTEYFIDKKTKDSTYNRGVYIAAWRKQNDGSWKISMDTWHAGLDKK